MRQFIKKVSILLGVFMVIVMAMVIISKDSGNLVSAASSSPVGYGKDTTGGSGGTTVTVSNYTDLLKYATATEKYIIQVSGTISMSDQIRVTSNKTIIGIGSNPTLSGYGFMIKGVSNVIVQNLTINHTVRTSDNDAICIDSSYNVWIDHCTLDSKMVISAANESHKDDVDGACDIKKGSYNVTISYNLFQNNWKNMLIGSSDSQTGDTAIRVTIHHNYFKNCSARQPSIRFGTAHIYNNYYENALTSVINSRMGAQTFIENNYFKNCNKSIGSWDSDYVGYWNLSGNILVDCYGETATTSTGSYKPTYSYSVDATANVPSIVTQSAGAGKMNVIPTVTVAPTAIPTISPTTTPSVTATPTPTPVGNQYEHNFTTSGTSSNFYTISGNLSDSKGTESYNGLTLTSCLKVESATSISFTTTKSNAKLLIYAKCKDAGGALKINGTERTDFSNIGTSAKVYSTTLSTAGKYTLTKSSNENYIYYMVVIQ